VGALGRRLAAGHGGECIVCRPMEAALTEYLSHYQFLLATRERDQERHANAGGFCPLHTWQYARMAFPLGISAGYAKLAVATADALELVRQPAACSRELARQVAGLATGRACPACAVLAGCERDEMSRVAQASAGEAPAPCACGTLPRCLPNARPRSPGGHWWERLPRHCGARPPTCAPTRSSGRHCAELS
jgi:hypothetical protein